MKAKEIQELISFLSESGLEEVNIETDNFKVSIKRSAEQTIVASPAPVAAAAPVAAPVPAAAPAPAPAATPEAASAPAAPKQVKRPIAISSGNGLPATERAINLLKEGADPLDAAIAGVNIVEADPNDMTVGYGGLPNEDGVVELDSSVMHGPTHKCGAVASLRGVKHPSKVAKLVLERTDHVLLVGKGALRFAQAHGFKKENLPKISYKEIIIRVILNLIFVGGLY